MKKSIVVCLPLLMLLVTGCPRNQYIVELTPHGDTIERKLTIYREDGTDTNGIPNYQDFPAEQLAAITKLYPRGSVRAEGKRHVAQADFANAMPGDVGGAGGWTNITTSLGSAAVYTERFRGNDDFATNIERKIEAVNQLTDLVIAWSGAEWGKEAGYENFRRFLDTDFRRDLKNFVLYFWAQDIANSVTPKSNQEFLIRFAQYLQERGYVKLAQLPEVFLILTRDNYEGLMPLVQRLVATRMGVPESNPIPASLAFLADDKAVVASWEKFLVTTEAYQTRIKAWELERQTNASAAEPRSIDVVGDPIGTLIDFRLFGSPNDHLVVKLSLQTEPLYTNGRWDATNHQVIWESDLEDERETAHLPAFCYAAWSAANEVFQKEHFGNVILAGQELLQYCLWRAGLNTKQLAEWETMLAALRSGSAIATTLDAFRFSDEPTQPPNGDAKQYSASEFGRQTLKEALTKGSQSSGK